MKEFRSNNSLAILLSAWLSNYESVGREFESLRAHHKSHKINNLYALRKAMQL
jgi:hypothetical protein